MTSSKSEPRGTLVSAVRMQFDYEFVRCPGEDLIVQRPHAARGGERAGTSRVGCRRVSRSCSREGARHRRRRLHRVAPVGTPARSRRRGDRARLLYRLLPAAHQGSERRDADRPAGFSFVESTIQAADLDRLLDGVTHVFHLAAQAGVRKSWGRDFEVYTTNNIEATQVLLEACVGKPLHRLVYASSSSVYGDAVAIPMREDAVPHPLSPYGVTKLAAEHLCHLYSTNHGVPATSVRYFTVYGPRQRPDMAFNRFLRAAQAGEPIARVRRWRADARLHVRRRRGRGHHRGGRPRRARARLQPRRRLARQRQRGARHRRRGSPARPCRSNAARRRRAMCATPTPTPRWRGRISASGRPCRWPTVWRNEVPLARVVSVVCMTQNRATRIALLVACVALALGAGACGGKKNTMPTGIAEADKFLFDRGTELLNSKKWLTRARVLRPPRRQLPAEPVPS